MTVVGYLIYGLILFPLSIIPMPVLYLFSDTISFILFRVAGYRRAVIDKNLALSFPEKTQAERDKIGKQFYRNFTDIFIAENIKALSPFKGYIKRMVRFENDQLMEELYNKGKGVILYLGHFGNWEYTAYLPVSPRFKHRMIALYKVQSTVADLILKLSRGKCGVELVPMEDVNKSFKSASDRPKTYMFIGDQSPGNPKSSWWTTFMNQETGVLFGTEKMAKIYNYAVVYLEITRVKRGLYNMRYELITETPKETQTGEITEMHTRLLEKSIIAHPDNWLWSHRRWKHTNPNKA